MVASQRCPSGEEHALHFCTLTRRIHVALPAVHGRVVERREACTADRGGGLAVPSARGPLHSLGSQTARHACRQIGGAAYQPPELTVEGGPHAVVRVFEQPQRLQHQHRLDCHQAVACGLAVTQRGAADVAAGRQGGKGHGGGGLELQLAVNAARCASDRRPQGLAQEGLQAAVGRPPAAPPSQAGIRSTV